MRFLKNNSYDIVRLFINQMGITIFSLVLYTALDVFEDKTTAAGFRIGLSVFATVFYLVLLYTAGWEYGAKDRLRVDAGKPVDGVVPNRMRLKGSLMAAIANIPNFFVALCAVVCMVVYMNGGAEGFYSAFAVFNLILRFITAMYLGIVQGIFSFLPEASNASWLWQSVGFGIMPIFAICATQLGYSLGYREFRILSLFKGGMSGDQKK